MSETREKAIGGVFSGKKFCQRLKQQTCRAEFAENTCMGLTEAGFYYGRSTLYIIGNQAEYHTGFLALLFMNFAGIIDKTFFIERLQKPLKYLYFSGRLKNGQRDFVFLTVSAC